MKKIILILLVLVFACKKENKELKETNNEIKAKSEVSILSDVKIPNISNWINIGIEVKESNMLFSGDSIYQLSRKDPQKPAHMDVNNLKINAGSNYKVSVIVKKGKLSSHFGLRIRGEYPNRLDNVFNLDKGTYKGPVSVGELAENEKAIIESVGDGWYKCSLITELYGDYVGIVLGPTKNTMKNTIWEAKTFSDNDIYIVPSSLKMEELSN